MCGYRTEGQIIIEESPTIDQHAVRMSDMESMVAMIPSNTQIYGQAGEVDPGMIMSMTERDSMPEILKLIDDAMSMAFIMG
jgi:hypothetical protein